MHKLTKWLRERFGDAPPSGPVDQEDVDEEMPDEVADGYTSIDPRPDDEPDEE